MKKKYYKLVNQDMTTYGEFEWKLGKWYEAKGDINQGLCSDAWLHCYESPLLAVLHNPMHAGIKNPKLFEVEVDGESKFDGQLKCGFREMRLVREFDIPIMTTTQKVAYSILCAKEVFKNDQFQQWSKMWLASEDRTAKAAEAAWAAEAAAWAAEAAARAAAWAAEAAAGAAAAWAAEAAARAATKKNLNLLKIAEEAMKY